MTVDSGKFFGCNASIDCSDRSDSSNSNDKSGGSDSSDICDNIESSNSSNSSDSIYWTPVGCFLELFGIIF